jgi:hypothetical protein
VPRTIRIGALLALVAALLALPVGALAAPFPTVFTYSPNMHPLGFSPRANTVSPFTANSDLAFQGRLAFQGNYDGFRIIDIHHKPAGSWTLACHDRADFRRPGPHVWRGHWSSPRWRDQSSRPSSPSRSRMSRWSCSNTPALARWFRPREAVAG